MIDRYTRPAMGAIWTDENKFRCWLQVEAAASAVLAEDGVIHGYNLPPSLQTPILSGTVQKGGLDARLGVIEYEMIIDALKTHSGNMSEAARELGLTRRIFGLRMKKYDINYKDYRLAGENLA